MSLAAETRRAVADHPFLLTALRAGVVNYTAAARFLAADGLEGDTDAIATALRRYAEEVPDYGTESRAVQVRMESGIGPLEREADAPGDSEPEALLAVGGAAFGSVDGDRTAIIATGEVDPTALAAALERLALEDVSTTAAAVGDGTMVLVVDRIEGANAVRAVEAALEGVVVRTDENE
ncbi:DUF7523 family protein [Halopiger xanaduensis]|uniref:Uncharacterized protein n=1 Tax=Halopiger xanaduensis (strain DSM 18323 / JCM 14033 / SH-6) TaxID=797210 RepID=F8D856_HALXS|nr:hypothetical protein [Halopiger xanaduensis]AEH37951.1 hypothetical protein Halxa_3339 [Halopiger xanaduensis SH-6]